MQVSINHKLVMVTALRASAIQDKLIENINKYYALGKKSCLLFLPMGGGKTVVASRLIASVVESGGRVLFCCHRTKLIEQTRRNLINFFGIEPGIIWGKNPVDYSKSVQIAMFQSLANRELPEDIDLCIFDEAHTTSYWNISKRIMNHYSSGILALSRCKFLGLTASPWRTKRKEGFCQFYDCMVKGPYFGEMVRLGELTPQRHFGWDGLIDYSLLEVGSDGDYTQSSLSLVCDENLNTRIVEELRTKFGHLKPIIFCGTVKQATDMAEKLNASGVECGLITGQTSEQMRIKIYEDYAKGKIRALSGVAVFVEGFDDPSCDAVVLARPTCSLSLLFQMCGRASRLYLGKQYGHLLDFCDNFQRLGLITKQHRIQLCPPYQNLNRTICLKVCPECQTVCNSMVRICDCGYAFADTILGRKYIKPPSSVIRSKFGEVLTLEQMRMIRDLRKRLHNSLTKGIDPSFVLTTYFEKYRTLPPSDWFYGAVFDDERHRGNMVVWNNFLHRVRPNAPQWWYEYWMQMEFGENDFYANLNNNFDWREFFALNSEATWQDVVEAYKTAVRDKDDSEILIANVALEKAALKFRNLEFVSFVKSNTAKVSSNRYKAMSLVSEVLSAVSKNDALTVRAAINRDLKLWQSEGLRLLKNDELFKITQLLKANAENFDISSLQPGSWVLTKSGDLLLIKSDFEFDADSVAALIKFGVISNSVKLDNYHPQFVDNLTGSDKLVYQNFVKYTRQASYLHMFVDAIVFEKIKRDLLSRDMLSKILASLNVDRDSKMWNIVVDCCNLN